MKHFIPNALAAKKLYLFVLVMLLSIVGIQKANAAKEIYAALSGSTMTIYYDDQKASRPGVLDKWSPEEGVDMDDATRNLITKAVISPSMVDARPTGTKWWFYKLTNLTTIEGLANLNTSEVTSMSDMFNGCSLLTSLDLSGFNTSNVTDMYAMFEGCSSLTSLNVSSFNTANVTYMSGMFQGCSSLTSLDLSSFNTANVMSMIDMFNGCSSLTSLDVSNFNTAKVVSMKNMFADCTSLTSLDLSNFNTANVEYMSGMFYGCHSLTSLNVSNFNTANVTDMRYMFEGCSSLTSLDLSSFNTANVTSMKYMFNGCTSLTTIYCDDAWNPSSSDYMFNGCTALVGGKGTKYDAGKKDKTYARPDGLGDQPGYFTAKEAGSKEIYAALSGSTMTIYYDDQKLSRPGILVEWAATGGGSYDVPDATCYSITKVVIDASMVDARPTYTNMWFDKFANLISIDGLTNLNTSEVVWMNNMFQGCESLTSLDLSSFNTANVTNMDFMFFGCSLLTSLDMSKFNTAKVEDMKYMFSGCSSLTSLDLSSFNTANVKNMSGMFYGCSSLTTIYCDDAWNPSSSDYMFDGCTALVGGKGTKYDAGKIDKTYARPDGLGDQPGYFTVKEAGSKEIYAALSGSTMTLYYDDQKASRPGVLADWSPGQGASYVPEETRNSITKAVINASMVDARPTSTYRWFRSLANLTTIDGLANLNTSEVTNMSYMFEGCSSLTSLDVSNFNTAKVTNMYSMFAYCSSLTSLDVSNFNTAKVTNMIGMFTYCSSLTSLDVSNFNTANVTSMFGMFEGCSSLKTIYCDDDWSTSSASSNSMFKNCTSLVGGKGTEYDAGKIDKTYAHLDGLGDQPGYFTAKGAGSAPEIVDGKLTVYEGTKGNNNLPIRGLYMDEYTRTQYIIPEAVLVNLTGQTVYGLRYYSSEKTVATLTSTVDVYIKVVANTEFLSLEFEGKDAADIVYTGTLEPVINTITGETEMAVVFDKPFVYSGGNLLVGFDNTTKGEYAALAFYGTDVTYNAGVWGHSDESLAAITGIFGVRFIPMTTFYVTDMPLQIVIDLINAIGSPITLESEPKIVKARTAFDALTAGQQALVTNYSVLTDAEAALAAIKDVTAPHDLKVLVNPNNVDISWQGAFDTYDIRVGLQKRYGFEKNLEGWTAIDADGDGHNWKQNKSADGFSTHNSSKGCAGSESYVTGEGALTPDNWLVSPQVTLGGSMTFWAAAQGSSDYEEHFAVFVSTSGNSDPSDFTQVSPEYIMDEGRVYKYYEVDLSAYSGKGYVAIRHFNCTDMFWLLIDDININEPDIWDVEESGLTDKKYALSTAGLETATEYTVQVRGHRGIVTSEWVEVRFTTPLSPEEQAAVQAVIDLINAIGTVTLESEPAINPARIAFDALKPALQEKVTNYDVLTAAEKALAELKNNIPIITDGWVHYDDGVYDNVLGGPSEVYWGIRIPANTVTKTYISKISMYVYVPGDYKVSIYAGGATPAEGTELYSEVVNMPNAEAFNEVDLANPVAIDPTQDIWVVFYCDFGDSYPMSCSNKTDCPNARWLSVDGGITWEDAANYGYDYTVWMIRAFFSGYTGEALIDGIRYYLNGDDMTAEVMTLGAGYYAGDIVLPEKVSYMKNDYAVTSVAGGAFRSCPELLTVTIPKSVNWIEPEVFYDSPKLTAVNVAAANANYSSLDGVLFNKAQTELRAYPTAKEGAYIVPEGVETIMDMVFAGNTHLTAVTLPASLYEIASHVFENCTGLEMITCRATNVPYLGGDVFVGVNKAIPVFVPKANIALYKAEDEWKDFTNYIAIEDKEAADAVIAKINAIGTVTYTPECKARIDAARGGYDALTAEQKVYIPAATYKILTDAEQAYADLKAKAEADQAAANAVIGKIDAIGTVTLSSEAAILDARSAYNALTAAQQVLVTNYGVLTAAEAKLEILKKQAESDEAAANAVIGKINAIGTVTYTSESKARIDAAREAYDALTAAQKTLVTNLTTLTAAEKAYADLKAKAEADQAAANIVIGKINAIGTVTYTPESKALIDAAREAYDALTDAQKGLVSSATYKILTDAEQTYADLKKKADADQAAANIVIGKINAIGTVTLSSEAAILDARSAYDALTAAQQVLVTNYGVLTAAEKAYADLKAKAEADQAAANAVIVKIDAIGTVTLSSEAAITAARSAYNALTADQKALVTNLPALTAAEAALDQLKKQVAADQAAANIVISKISAIGTVTYTPESKALIDAAREAYAALTDAQKALVTNYATLTAAEKAYADLKAKAEADQAAANAVIVKIDAIGDVTLASEPAIVDARSAFNALTAAQQALVTNLSTLTAAEAKLEILKKQAEGDEAAANAVTGLISAIGTVEYTSESKSRIDAAREAYDALTAVQQGLVTNYGVLTAAEQAYADLKKKADADQAAANAVIGKINAIGTVTLSSEAAITAAREAYNALTPAQQALVTNYGTLLSAETTLELLKHQAETDQAAANAVIGKIDAIGKVSYTPECKALIDAARSAYDALTAAQQGLVTNYDKLITAEKVYAELKANAEAVANAKLQLKNIVSQANELKMVAMLYAPTAVTDIDAIINDAQSMIDDPKATVDQVNAKAATLTDNLNTLAVSLLDQAKEQLKQSLRDLYLPGDYPSWYATVIIPALDQVDGVTWDFNKPVQENILYFQVTGQNLYNATKAALEALRGTDKRSIISSCAFTGFENGIKVDMTWNISALNNLINTLNASVAAEPYRLDAEMSSLGKWDPVNKELIILDPYEAQKLTAGEYQFVTAVKIDGEDAKQYRLPKAAEEVLSVTVDAAVWSVDLSGIVIDATYSYTYVTSPMFTISKSVDVELDVEQTRDDQLKTQKIYQNGHFYILRGDHIFDIRGTMVK